MLAIHCFFFAHFLPQTGLSVWGSLGSYGPLTQKEAKAVCKFLLLCKGCSPGSHYFASVSGLAFLACSPTTVWVLLAARLYNVIHFSPTCPHLCPTCLLLTCISHDVPGVPQQHPPSSTGQAETRNNDQAKRESNCSKHPPAAPAQRREQEEGKSTNQR